MTGQALKFDTLEYTKRLQAVGCDPKLAETQAKEQVKIINALLKANTVTHKDIGQLVKINREEASQIKFEIADLKQVVSQVKQKISESELKAQNNATALRADTLQAIADGRLEFQQTITETRTELQQSIAETRTELQQSIVNTRTELLQFIASTRSEIVQSISDTRNEQQQALAETRNELQRSIANSRTETQQQISELDEKINSGQKITSKLELEVSEIRHDMKTFEVSIKKEIEKNRSHIVTRLSSINIAAIAIGITILGFILK